MGNRPTPNFKINQVPEKIKFKPLDTLKEMTGKEILEKHPTGIKYAHLLKNARRYPLLIDAENHILSMPPIINSEDYAGATGELRA